MFQLNTPVTLFIFNRPELTRIVFDVIAKVKPTKLFVVADGPRTPEEAIKCDLAREIIDRVDWECDILRNFSESNLGSGRRVSTGITWVFEHVSEAIILEDDCVPDLSFFHFCQELLEKYRDDKRVMMISGNNYLPTDFLSTYNYSYYFSRYTHIWGWATWRRAWEYFDLDMALWPEVSSQGWLEDIYDNPEELLRRVSHFERTFSHEIDSWAYPWSFTCLSQSGLVIRPAKNLVTNIGFGVDATNTKKGGVNANYPSYKMDFPIKHPPYVMRNARYDKYEVYKLMGNKEKQPERDGYIKRFFANQARRAKRLTRRLP